MSALSPDTVLIIEDSRSFAMSLESALLEHYTYNVIIAYNYAETLTLLEQHKDEIFVAISDLNLPDAEDGAAAKAVIELGIPCIAFTGNFSPALRADVLSLGVSDYVLKKGQDDIDYVVRMVDRLKSNQFLKVLVVDDSNSSRAYLKELLLKQCYQVFVVASGEEALEVMEREKDIRMLLIDLVMEGMDGFELLSQVRRNYDTTQMAIIGLSGMASPGHVAKFMKYGGNDFLMKPFEHEQVTCRVNSNAQLLDQFARLTSLNEQKNELLGMAAHDIRGPLGVVMSATSMLAREELSEQGQMLLSLATEAADDMENLLNSLLDMSSIESAKISINKENIDLTEVVGKVVKDVTLMSNSKEQDIDLSLPMGSVMVEADRSRIQEVLLNLLSNAIKYSERGGKIEVDLSHNQNSARVQVKDEAGGIPEEEQGLLFRPFSQISTQPTDGERSTGLGLSICQRIMDQHHGKILYRDHAGVGSNFEIVMPLSKVLKEQKKA